MEFISIEELVPADHLLRKIEAAIDFNFIYEKVEGLYSEISHMEPSVNTTGPFPIIVVAFSKSVNAYSTVKVSS